MCFLMISGGNIRRLIRLNSLNIRSKFSDDILLHVKQCNLLYSIQKYSLLTHVISLVSFCTPGKHQKTIGFLMFPGGIERDQWHEIC